MKPIAFVISIVCERLEPCSGRSEAIRKFADDDPCTGPHDERGSGVSAAPFVTLAMPAYAPNASAKVPTTATTATRKRFLTLFSLLGSPVRAMSAGSIGVRAAPFQPRPRPGEL